MAVDMPVGGGEGKGPGRRAVGRARRVTAAEDRIQLSATLAERGPGERRRADDLASGDPTR